jgi:antitoxin component HigA of HigAB toxin-antitoxin module
MTDPRNSFETFIDDPEHRRIYEQERLLVDATELIATVMKFKGMKRGDLAEKLGKSRAFITQVLRGNQNLTLKTIGDLLYAMNYRLAMRALPLVAYDHGVACPEFELGCWTVTQSAGNNVLQNGDFPPGDVLGEAA